MHLFYFTVMVVITVAITLITSEMENSVLFIIWVAVWSILSVSIWYFIDKTK